MLLGEGYDPLVPQPAVGAEYITAKPLRLSPGRIRDTPGCLFVVTAAKDTGKMLQLHILDDHKQQPHAYLQLHSNKLIDVLTRLAQSLIVLPMLKQPLHMIVEIERLR